MATLYGHRWRIARARHLALHPRCVYCAKQGYVTPATVVDHIEPHRGDSVAFWAADNWQSLCKIHHDGAKQRLEKSGYLVGSDADGLPLDPRHPWHRGTDE